MTAAIFRTCISVAHDITKKAAEALALRHDRRHSITVCESPSQPTAPSESETAAATAAAASYLSFNPSSFMSMAMEAVTSFMESGDTSTNPVSNAWLIKQSWSAWWVYLVIVHCCKCWVFLLATFIFLDPYLEIEF